MDVIKEGEDMSSSTVSCSLQRTGPSMRGAALKDFRAAQRAGWIDLIDAAVIVHTAEDKIKFEETANPSGKKWAKRGAIAGGVVGLIFPPSIIAGAVVGGGAGGLRGKIRDKGFKDGTSSRSAKAFLPAHRRSSQSLRTA